MRVTKKKPVIANNARGSILPLDSEAPNENRNQTRWHSPKSRVTFPVSSVYEDSSNLLEERQILFLKKGNTVLDRTLSDKVGGFV